MHPKDPPSDREKQLFADLVGAAITGKLAMVKSTCSHTGREVWVLVILGETDGSGAIRTTPIGNLQASLGDYKPPQGRAGDNAVPVYQADIVFSNKKDLH